MLPNLDKSDIEKGKDEKTPLMTDRSSKNAFGTVLPAALNPLAQLGSAPPVLAYDPEQLTNWRAVIVLNGTIFLQPAVLLIIASQFCISAFVCLLIVFFAQHPESYKSDSMDQVVKTIAVSIAFLLGMFLSSCINRWWDTIKSLESLFGTIKRLTMTAINLELPSAARVMLERRCVLSTRCLQVELAENHMILSGKAGPEELNKHWEEYFHCWGQEGKITPVEAAVLRRVPPQQRSFFAWSLVSQDLISIRPQLLSKDGQADLLAYDRLCDLVQDGVASVSNVRTAAAFQMPYVYVHMLAFMIHFVNMITALGTGVKVGLLVSTSMKANVPIDFGQIGTALIFLFVQAFIYQAFLTIGAALSFPITGAAYRIPLLQMVDNLHKQLTLMNHLADDYGKDEKDINPDDYKNDDGEEFFD